MTRRSLSFVIPIVALLPFVLAAAQETPPKEPMAEQVFKDIRVFKGVPANDLIPAMKFMAGSLKVECEFCHDKNDFSKETRGKETGRKMVEMQRDINTKFFNGRLEVTCNSCHNGMEKPSAIPVPTGLRTRHDRYQTSLKPDDFIKKHLDGVGTVPAVVTLTGTVQKGNEAKKPYSMVQSSDGRFMVKNGDDSMGFDGKTTWYQEGGHAFPLDGEGEASVKRLGQSWRTKASFDGLERWTVSGKEKLGTADAIVVRGVRTANNTTDEFYFDEKTGRLARAVTLTRSTIGTVVDAMDYSDYRTVKGVRLPFAFTFSSAGGESTSVKFTSATTSTTVDDKMFAMPTG